MPSDANTTILNLQLTHNSTVLYLLYILQKDFEVMENMKFLRRLGSIGDWQTGLRYKLAFVSMDNLCKIL